jgi:hypothetical protein
VAARAKLSAVTNADAPQTALKQVASPPVNQRLLRQNMTVTMDSWMLRSRR